MCSLTIAATPMASASPHRQQPGPSTQACLYKSCLYQAQNHPYIDQRDRNEDCTFAVPSEHTEHVRLASHNTSLDTEASTNRDVREGSMNRHSPSMAATTELTPMASPSTHSTTASPMVPSMIFSSRVMPPILSKRLAASLGASGVSLISGGEICSRERNSFKAVEERT